MLLDNFIYAITGTSFCVPSGKWGGAITGSQGGDESRCPSDPRKPLTLLWQAGRDNGIDDNGTFSRPPKDLGGVPAACACSGKAAATAGL
ncbi:hypothetical protein E1963_13845 [Extibacter muris]|uniref:Uncharacterized protein n=1 Tax=Extibacter muris TaxID=1796622 RepID=A0A4R4FC30_9FIRM|nr:hypothetical protein [Extibacter muris]TDA21027.1 hypothetical protein E1963_13845 [Extibacter muris]